MQIDAIWLLKNHRYLLSRQKFLRALIPAIEKQSISDEEIIESITYCREYDGLQKGSRTNTSRTEYAATHLDSLRNEQETMRATSIKQWSLELETINMLLQIYDIAVSILTEEEQALVEKFYNENLPICSLENIPLTKDGYAKSRSTLKRMLKRIEHKMDQVISIRAG